MCRRNDLTECYTCGKTYDKNESREANKCKRCVMKMDKKQSDRRAFTGKRSDQERVAMGKEYVKYYEGVE